MGRHGSDPAHRGYSAASERRAHDRARTGRICDPCGRGVLIQRRYKDRVDHYGGCSRDDGASTNDRRGHIANDGSRRAPDDHDYSRRESYHNRDDPPGPGSRSRSCLLHMEATPTHASRAGHRRPEPFAARRDGDWQR
jgi:hypothetical protein